MDICLLYSAWAFTQRLLLTTGWEELLAGARAEKTHIIVPSMKHTSQQVPGWGDSLALSTGLPLSPVAGTAAGSGGHHKQESLQHGP